MNTNQQALFKLHEIVNSVKELVATDGTKIPQGSYFRVNHISRTTHPNPALNVVALTLEVTGSSQKSSIGKTVELPVANISHIAHTVNCL